MMGFSVQQFKTFLLNVASMVEEKKEYLCELDRKIGDGDHGVTMSIGWQAIKKELESTLADEEDCAVISSKIGRTFLSAVGSSVGPLYATGFMRGAKVLKESDISQDDTWCNYWIAFIDGVHERGSAEIGDKTMMDALLPAKAQLVSEENKGLSMVEVFELAVESALDGAAKTKDMLSKRGRSSRLGERSIGNQDPGATSVAYVLEEYLKSLKTAVQV